MLQFVGLGRITCIILLKKGLFTFSLNLIFRCLEYEKRNEELNTKVYGISIIIFYFLFLLCCKHHSCVKPENHHYSLQVTQLKKELEEVKRDYGQLMTEVTSLDLIKEENDVHM